jgi:hypothetical protein
MRIAIPLVTLLVCNFADVVTTDTLLGMGGREMNPVAGWLIAKDALVLAKFSIVALIGVCAVVAPRRKWIVPGLWAVASLYTLIISFHMVQLAVVA